MLVVVVVVVAAGQSERQSMSSNSGDTAKYGEIVTMLMQSEAQAGRLYLIRVGIQNSNNQVDFFS